MQGLSFPVFRVPAGKKPKAEVGGAMPTGSINSSLGSARAEPREKLTPQK
jgi:hypothetical protein